MLSKLIETASPPTAPDVSNIYNLPIRKRSAEIHGHKTSVSMEDPFWYGLKQLAEARGIALFGLLTLIYDQIAVGQNFSSACRLYVLASQRALLAAHGLTGRTSTATGTGITDDTEAIEPAA